MLYSLIISELFFHNPDLKSHKKDNEPFPVKMGAKIKISVELKWLP